MRSMMTIAHTLFSCSQLEVAVAVVTAEEAAKKIAYGHMSLHEIKLLKKAHCSSVSHQSTLTI